MNLTENFTLEEFTKSRFAALHEIKNVPNERQAISLYRLCLNVLQPLRNAAQRPIVITSGFRSSIVNTAVHGNTHSQHMLGEAADFYIPGFSFVQVLALIRSHNLPVDQIIDEFGQWVHISHKESGIQRGEVLVTYHSDNRMKTQNLSSLKGSRP